MSAPARILVVDDAPANVKLLDQVLRVSGYDVVTAASGREGLAKLAASKPDLVLLDVVMPEMSGYEVCRAIRADPATVLLPVVMVTALDPETERVKGIEAGADDFLSKPINQPELLARVKSLLRIRALHRKVEEQAAQLAEWNARLEDRVAEQMAQLERLARLRRFLSPKVADLIVAGELDDPLATRRREVTIMFVDMRGFTAFSETAAPEDVLGVLRDYHGEIGRLVSQYEGTVEHFAGDGVMLIFNDPAPLPDPAYSAIRMALELRDSVSRLSESWSKLGYRLHCGIGIAQGYATIGTIGFPGRQDYGVVGQVNSLAARLCAEAAAGHVLVSQRVFGRIEERVVAERLGELTLKGFHAPVPAYSVLSLKRATTAEIA
ncbi:MAG TPA: response regulator [Usitatibacter sp.]|nr:response regulator [Usitatibacter sp.]